MRQTNSQQKLIIHKQNVRFEDKRVSNEGMKVPILINTEPQKNTMLASKSYINFRHSPESDGPGFHRLMKDRERATTIS